MKYQLLDEMKKECWESGTSGFIWNCRKIWTLVLGQRCTQITLPFRTNFWLISSFLLSAEFGIERTGDRTTRENKNVKASILDGDKGVSSLGNISEVEASILSIGQPRVEGAFVFVSAPHSVLLYPRFHPSSRATLSLSAPFIVPVSTEARGEDRQGQWGINYETFQICQ